MSDITKFNISYEQTMSAIRQVLQNKIDELGRGGQIILAMRAGISVSFFSQLMSGKRQGNLKVWMSIIEATNYSLPEFMAMIGQRLELIDNNIYSIPAVYRDLCALPNGEAIATKVAYILKNCDDSQRTLIDALIDGCHAAIQKTAKANH